jgi:flagellar P-ring protein precursor FlgI
MLQNLGISTQGGHRASKRRSRSGHGDPAAVCKPGLRIDVSGRSLGDATSLRGGTLIMTSLSGADGQIYAVAQGSVIVSGFRQGEPRPYRGCHHCRPRAERRDHRARTAGALQGRPLVLQLRNPDFSTSIAHCRYVINSYAEPRYGGRLQRPGFAGGRRRQAEDAPICALMAEIEGLNVETDSPARVVINERTGTIVIGMTSASRRSPSATER